MIKFYQAALCLSFINTLLFSPGEVINTNSLELSQFTKQTFLLPTRFFKEDLQNPESEVSQTVAAIKEMEDCSPDYSAFKRVISPRLIKNYNSIKTIMMNLYEKHLNSETLKHNPESIGFIDIVMTIKKSLKKDSHIFDLLKSEITIPAGTTENSSFCNSLGYSFNSINYDAIRGEKQEEYFSENSDDEDLFNLEG